MTALARALEIGSGLCLVIGAFFFLVTAIGILRFPDAFTRLHAGTKGLTVGTGFVLLGSALSGPSASHVLKTFLIAAFLLITNPIAVHALARANYRWQRRRMRLVVDEYQEWKGGGAAP